MTNRIRELRQNARLSQTELAKLLDVDEACISRWEAGKRPLSPEVIERLARVFKVSSWELFLDRKRLRDKRLSDNDEREQASEGGKTPA